MYRNGMKQGGALPILPFNVALKCQAYQARAEVVCYKPGFSVYQWG
jgi:hypothetical protein